MTLTFPNPSRSFDVARNAVRFTGYDGMFQVAFLIEASALVRSDETETNCLSAFDTLRTCIYSVARKVYTRHRNTIYTLTAADFG